MGQVTQPLHSRFQRIRYSVVYHSTTITFLTPCEKTFARRAFDPRCGRIGSDWQ